MSLKRLITRSLGGGVITKTLVTEREEGQLFQENLGHVHRIFRVWWWGWGRFQIPVV